MHNRASSKGIDVMLEDSTSDTSTPKAFKSLSTILTSFWGRSHLSEDVILFPKSYPSILLGFVNDYGAFAGVFDFSSVCPFPLPFIKAIFMPKSVNTSIRVNC
jgi:hypothetical protein